MPPPCLGAFLVSLRPEGPIMNRFAAPGRLQFFDYVTESLRPEKQRGSVFLCSDRTILLKFTGYIEKYYLRLLSETEFRILVFNPPSPPILCLNLGFWTTPKKRKRNFFLYSHMFNTLPRSNSIQSLIKKKLYLRG